MTYDWDISRQATEKIIGLPKKHRNQIIHFLDRLGMDPQGLTEATFYDASGALHQMATVNSWVVTFVVDDPVKRIHIIAIE